MPSDYNADDSTLIPSEPLGATRDDTARSADAPTGTRFRPTEKLGEGGQGEVWLALDPELDRQVALKVVRRDRLGSDETREKLRLEAEVAGKLEHPNIVAVYEVGRQHLGDDPAQGDPPPYCVMRFYRKHTLKEAVEEFHAQPWSEPKFRELLLRFIDVCNAVAYAHSRGVIHRDLKPENVMLGEFGETLLVDWGLAKIVGRDEIHKTIDGAGTMQLDRDPNATIAGSIKGTLRYMSPEQARGEVATLAQPTDVYGLGAILYHVLTARPPVDLPIDHGALDLQEVLQHVREGRIDPPRDRNPQVPRALQAICLQALSLKPLDRYRSAVALADDVTRWLNDEPVTAYRDPLLTRSRRWLRRHQALAASSAVAVLVGLLALSSLLVMVRINNERLAAANADLQQANQRESAARREAEENEREANRQKKLAEANERKAEEQSKLAAANAATARQQTQLAIGTLNTVIFDIQRGLENVPGAGDVRRKLLGTALERLRQISDEFGDADVVDRQRSVVLMEMADTVLRIGLSDDDLQISGGQTQSAVEFAVSLYRRASDSLERLAAVDHSNTKALRDLLASYDKLGDALLHSGRVREALAICHKAVEIGEDLAATDPDDMRTRHALWVCYGNLGDVLRQSGQISNAIVKYQQALAIGQNLAAGDPSDALLQRNLSATYDKLGDVLLRSNDVTLALAQYQKGMDICQKLAADDPGDAVNQRDLAICHENLTDALMQSGKVTEALAQCQKFLEISQKLAAADTSDAKAQRDLSVSYSKLGDVLLQSGQLKEARAQYQKHLELCQYLAAADPSNAVVQRDLSISYERVGDVLRLSGETDEALAKYKAAMQIEEKLAAGNPSDAQAQRGFWLSCNNFAAMLHQTGKVNEALMQYEKNVETGQRLAKTYPSDVQIQHGLATCHVNLGNVLRECGRGIEALAQHQHALEIRRKLAADITSALAQHELMLSYYKLGLTQRELFAYAEAAQEFREALAVLDAMIERGQNIDESRSERAVVERTLRDAILCPIATKAWETVLAHEAEQLPTLLYIRSRELARQNRLDEAAQAAAKLKELQPREKDNFYQAACGYALCAKAVKMSEPAELTAEQMERRREFQGLAITCLQEAIAAGWDNFEHMVKDDDLSAIRDLPEFKALLPADSRGDAGGDGLEAKNESPDAS